MNETTNDGQSSINLKKMAKGYQWDIKIYFDAGNPMQTEQKILQKIENIDAILKAKYGDT